MDRHIICTSAAPHPNRRTGTYGVHGFSSETASHELNNSPVNRMFHHSPCAYRMSVCFNDPGGLFSLSCTCTCIFFCTVKLWINRLICGYSTEYRVRISCFRRLCLIVLASFVISELSNLHVCHPILVLCLAHTWQNTG